jgi:hypothetical protein
MCKFSDTIKNECAIERSNSYINHMALSPTVTICILIILCVSSSVSATCWGKVSFGHCTGLGTGPGDIGYDKMGVLNTIASSRRFSFKNPWVYDDPMKVFRSSSIPSWSWQAWQHNWDRQYAL